MHLLIYNNVIEIEALIAVTGKWLRPDFEGEPYRQVLHPELFEQLINGYEKVVSNLSLHSSGWYSPEHLRSIVTTGQKDYGIDAVGEGKESPGSEKITSIILENDPRPVYIVVNAGANTLAQALLDYRRKHSQSELDAYLAKMIIYDNGAQDDAGAWIAKEFPSVHYIRSTGQKNAFGSGSGKNDRLASLGPWSWKPFEYSFAGQHEWAKENIQTNHGELGKLYPDRYMEGRYWFIEGGGTIPWLGLISTGLYDPLHQNWGGFSGRYTTLKKADEWSIYPEVELREKSFGTFMTYVDTSDTWTDPIDGFVYENNNTPVYRWRQALYDDFKCRIDCCVEPFDEANHNPVAVLNNNSSREILYMSAIPGDILIFDASKSFDPDKNQELTFSWWIYKEAGTYEHEILLSNSNKEKLSFNIPVNAGGKQIHMILDVSDNSEIAKMHDFRRIVIDVK
jgi:hypothetical protein